MLDLNVAFEVVVASVDLVAKVAGEGHGLMRQLVALEIMLARECKSARRGERSEMILLASGTEGNSPGRSHAASERTIVEMLVPDMIV